MSTQTAICNLALSLIGNEGNQITDFDNDTGKAARQCRLHYQPTLDELLRTHTWGCSKKRAELIATIPSITMSDDEVLTDKGATVGGKAQFLNAADASATYAIEWNSTTDEWEYGTYITPNITATFTNSGTGNVPPETGWEPVTTGTLSLTHNYGFGWDTAFRLPSDCIRPVYLASTENSNLLYKSNIDWTVEGRTILTNYSDSYLMYIGEPSTSDMDPLFTQAFYTLLASKLAIPVAGDPNIKRDILEEFMSVIMPEARRVNGFEGYELPMSDSEWLQATYSSSTSDNSWPPFAAADYGTFSW